MGAFDFFYEETDGLEHAADLAVAAFDERDFVPGIAGVFEKTDFCRRGFDASVVVERDGDAVAKALDGLFIGLAADFDVVGSGDVRDGAGELLGEGAVVGEQEQAFAGVIEAADGIDALPEMAEELHDGGTAFGVGDGGDVAFGFVQQEIDEALRLERFSVDSDCVGGRVGFAAEFGDGFAVDSDAARGDELFGFAAGGKAGSGEDFLKAEHRELLRDGFTLTVKEDSGEWHAIRRLKIGISPVEAGADCMQMLYFL